MVWHKKAKESFCNLKSMQVRDCYSLLTIFQFSMPRLLTVGVNGCALVEENFDLQKVNFEELDISRLPKLKHIWNKDPQAKLSFKELPMPKRLSVGDCDSIEEIFDLQKDSFPNLEKLILRGKAIKMIYLYEEDETHVGVDSKLDTVLSKLESLTVDDSYNSEDEDYNAQVEEVSENLN
ncbi:hypothetical protein Q3G72_010219 [Acer saccharum]|nr:hypothetical protein Q3G72_010219 [Acer saccharum]